MYKTLSERKISWLSKKSCYQHHIVLGNIHMVIGLTKQKIIKDSTMISEHEHETQLINLEWKRRRVMHQDVIYRGRFNWIQTVTGVFQNNYVDRIKRSNHHLLSSIQRCQLWLSYFLFLINKAYSFLKLGIFDLKIKLLSMSFGKTLPCTTEYRCKVCNTVFHHVSSSNSSVLFGRTHMVIVKGWSRRYFWWMHQRRHRSRHVVKERRTCQEHVSISSKRIGT